MKNLLIILCLSALLPLSAQPDSSLADTTWLYDPPQTEHSKTGLVIGEGESLTVEGASDSNMALMGGEVSVNAPIWADLMILGGDIDVMDVVTGNITTTGGRIKIRKPVGEDVRAIGGEITISDSVYGNVIAIGGSIEIEPGAVIMGDALLVGGEVKQLGEIHGKVHLRAGSGKLSGTIQGSVNARCGEIELMGEIYGNALLASSEIDLEEGAQLHGDVRYWTEGGEMDFSSVMMGGLATFDPELEPEWSFDWEWFGVGAIIFWILTTLGGILLMAFITLLFPDWIKRAGAKVKESPLKSLGIGVLYFLLVPIAAGVLFMSIIGIPLGFIVVFLYGITILYAMVFTAMAMTGWINAQSGKDWKRFTLFGVSILVFIGLRVLMFVPILGWIVTLIAALIGFGGLLAGVKKNRTPAVEAA